MDVKSIVLSVLLGLCAFFGNEAYSNIKDTQAEIISAIHSVKEEQIHQKEVISHTNRMATDILVAVDNDFMRVLHTEGQYVLVALPDRFDEGNAKLQRHIED